MLAAYRESGLTRAAFAKREGICYATFCHWAQRAAKAAITTPSAPSPVRFAEVALPSRASTNALEVSLPDGTVVRGGSVEELAALARALRRA